MGAANVRLPPDLADPGCRRRRRLRGKSRQTSTIRKGSIAPIPACRPPGPLRRDDHRVSTRAPALRRVRVRAVLGRRRGARDAIEPAHGDATAGQDPRGRRQDAARRQQPRDKGVLSGTVAVRSDLLRRLRASSPPHPGHRRVRAGLGAPPALHDGLPLPRAPRRGDLPVQEPALAKAGGLPSRKRRTACCRATSSAATLC